MSCNRCGKLPELFFANSDVYMNLPTDHLRELFEHALDKEGYHFEQVDEGYLLRQVEFKNLINYLSTFVFNSVEQKDVKILALKKGDELKYSSLKHYRSLLEWHVLYQGQEVAFIINGSRIKTLFQPIVESKTGEIYGYEALSRGILKDDTMMNPEQLFSKAKAMDLLFYLDRLCRETSIRSASRQGITKKLFINFIPTAIYEPSLCLQSTAKVLEEEEIDSGQVVFEVVETEKVVDFGHLNQILDYYKSKGYSTALDDIGSGYSDISSLLKLRPDYMKIDMTIIRDIHIDEKKQALLDMFIEHGQKIGLKILVEGIETVEEYQYLLTKNVDLMQGYLFGKPEEVPINKIRLL